SVVRVHGGGGGVHRPAPEQADRQAQHRPGGDGGGQPRRDGAGGPPLAQDGGGAGERGDQQAEHGGPHGEEPLLAAAHRGQGAGNGRLHDGAPAATTAPHVTRHRNPSPS